MRRLSFAVSNCRCYTRHPPVVASAFSSGHQNDAPTQWFLFTVIVVIVANVVVVIVVVVVVVIPPPPPAAAATSTLKYPAGADSNLPGAVNTNGCPGALLAAASRL